MNSILTTDRPLSNDDRRNLWRDKWRIESNPKPIPSRAHDWDWHHVDFDGAPDSGDTRCGTASSAADAIQQINEITSPAVQGQPQGVNLATCIRDALGFVLVMTVCVAFVGLLGMQAGVW
jgi:hypothetical protein